MHSGPIQRVGHLALATLVAAGFVGLSVLPRGAPAGAYSTGADYAAEAFSDPWDYSNPEDIVIADDGPMRSATNVSLESGLLRFDMDRPGYIHPLWGGYPGALPQGREGAARPIDASRFQRIVFRMLSTSEVPAGVRWYPCQDIGTCQGGFNFFTVPGWHTYDFPLVAIDQPALTVPWSGEIVSLRLALSPSSSTHFELDWLRLAPSGVTVAGEDVGPVPQIDEPDVTGGSDYATTARNDPWDFDQPSDLLRMDNVNGAMAGGQLHATNAPPQVNDPSATLRLGPAFRGEQFHRVTVVYSYEGPFSLQDSPGGGTVARIIWRVAGTPLTKNGVDLQNSDDIVTYPNQQSFSVDLSTNPSAAVTDPAQVGPRIGWAGQMIEMVRIDPNEDRGPRRWRLDHVKLAEDDATTDRNGQLSFEVVWHDNAYQPGTSADLYYDTDDRGFDGTPLATGLAVQQGRNSYVWTPPAGLTGRVFLYVVHRRAGQTGRSYSTGPLLVGPPVTPQFGPAVGGPSSQAGWVDPAARRAQLGSAAAPKQLALTTATKSAAKRPTTTPAKTLPKTQAKTQAKKAAVTSN